MAARFAVDTKLRLQIIKTHIDGYYAERPDFEQWLAEEFKMTVKEYFQEVTYLLEFGFMETKVFLVRETALDIARKINIKDEGRFTYLERVPEGDYAFILNQNAFMKFFRIATRFVVFVLERDEKGEHYCMFNFETNRGYDQIGEDDMSQRYAHLFFQLCIFWQFAEPETILLPEGRKSGTRKNGKVLNDAPFGVTMLDSTWNKIVVRTDGFDVNGHLRLQPVGEGRKDRKLIWINPFKKQGYIKKSGKVALQ